MENKKDSYEEINKSLTNIAEIIDKHFNPPPKKIKWDVSITLILTGVVVIWALFRLYQMLLPIFNYNININY